MLAGKMQADLARGIGWKWRYRQFVFLVNCLCKLIVETLAERAPGNAYILYTSCLLFNKQKKRVAVASTRPTKKMQEEMASQG